MSDATPSLVEVLLAQREAWQRGERPAVEALLDRHPHLRDSADAVLDLIYNERMLREEAGEEPGADEYLARFPHLAEALRVQFEVDQAITAAAPEQAAERPSTWTGPTPPAGSHLPDLPGYEVLGELGRGAMGVVFRAWQRAARRVVALKLLFPGVPLFRVRIEAEAAARLQHPHIVQLFEVHEVAGRPALVFEFVENGNLAKRLDGKPQPPRDAARLIEALAGAMAYAHARGVVHRDLKPSNVLLASPADTPLGACAIKISDFGLAKLASPVREPGERDLTRTTDVLGTPSYMAPEQASGDARQAGPAADVYALGAILYECLTGRPPFLGEGVLDTLDQLRTQEPIPPRRLRPGVPRDLEVIALRCLHKSPARRYAGARELADDLRAFLDGRPIKARPVSAAERAWKWARRRPGLAAAGALLVLAGVALLGLGVYFNRQVSRQRDRAEEQARLLAMQLRHTRQLLFTVQLQRVSALLDTDPLQGRQMLEEDTCPRDLRDFAWGVLYARCRRDRLGLAGHEQPVAGLAFRPGTAGRLLASAGQDGEVRLWDAGTGRSLAVLRDHSDRVTCVAFSADGRVLASAGHDRTVRLYDLEGGEESPQPRSRPPLRADGPVWSVAFHPDGTTLAASAGPAGAAAVAVWNLKSTRLRKTLPGKVRAGSGLAYSPDGRWLAGCAADRTVVLWDAKTGKLHHALKGHRADVTGVAFAPEGRPLASADVDGRVCLWDAAEGLLLDRREVEGGPVAALAFGATAQTLAVACGEPAELFGSERPRPVYLLDLHTHEPAEVLLGHRGAVTSLAFRADGKALATGGADRQIKLWDVPGPRQRLALTGQFGAAGSVALASDGRALAWVARGKRPGAPPAEVIVYDLEGGSVRNVLQGHRRAVRVVALSADGLTAATAAGEGDEPPELTLWDVRTGKPLHALSGHASAVTALVFSPDSRTLFSASWDGSVRAWDVGPGRERYALRLKRGAPLRFALSDDGQTLAAVADEAGRPVEVRLWDTDTGRQLRSLPGIAARPTCLAFSPRGGRLAMGSANGRVLLLDAATGEMEASLEAGVRGVSCVAFSRDGRTLTVGGATAGVKLWDLATRQERAALPGHEGGAVLAAFVRDGRTLVTAGAGQARFWRALLP
jgi:WD40 repeat protein